MTILLALAGVATIILALWFCAALWLVQSRNRSLHQAFLHIPLKALWRIEDHTARNVDSTPPTVYAVLHQSQLDPALMLSLLPSDTLHILDEKSARSPWLEPWREMARTIAFNPAHVFVSRRLVRQLKGRGRLAVYFPDGLEQDSKAFRVYRAVARIAAAADARIVPISVQGSRHTRLAPSDNGAGKRLFPKLRVLALAPLSMTELVERAGEGATMAGALHARVMEADAAQREAQALAAAASAASRRA